MKRFTLRKKILAGAAAAALVAGVGGAAFGFFTTTGSGTGSASVGALQTNKWGVVVSADTTHALFPGSGSETLTYTITNSDTGNQALTSVTASVPALNSDITELGVEVPGCLASWFTATAGAPTPGLGVSIAPTTSATGSVSVSMSNVNLSQDVCAGHTPDITGNAA